MHPYRDVAAVDWGVCLDKATSAGSDNRRLLSYLVCYETEQMAKDLELFAQHGGRKTVNMEDVILSGMF